MVEYFEQLSHANIDGTNGEAETETVELNRQNKLFQEERDCSQVRILIPEVEGYVFNDKGTFLGFDTFTSEDTLANTPDNLIGLVRPILVNASEKGISSDDLNPDIAVKATYAMGKSVFIEFPVYFKGANYNFVQWKGILNNTVFNTLPDRAGDNWQFPFGKEGIAPLFTLRNEPWNIIRFAGSAPYGDLLLEKDKVAQLVETGLRTPPILGTFKFSRKFCEENSLPLPQNDTPDDLQGESLPEFIERNKNNLSSEEYERLRSLCGSSFDVLHYKSAILGESVRIFRNVWRVSEVEDILKETDEQIRSDKLSAVLETSKKIFEKEFDHEFTTDEFIKEFSYLMGEQSAILLKNKVVHGAMKEHKQDVTLGAEICDWDCAYKLNNDYFENPEHMPDWVRDAPENEKSDATEEWVYREDLKMVRQILLLASNIKPILTAGQEMGSKLLERDAVNSFVEGLSDNLTDEKKGQLYDFILNAKDFQDIERIAGKSKERNDPGNQAILNNFKSYQDYFDMVTEVVKARLNKT